MPAWSVLRAADLPRLGPIALSAGLIEAELRSSEPGRTIVVHGLLDVVFALALRAVSAQCAQARAGWSQAVRDPQIRRVIALMHEDCAHPWTLDELAQRAGLSRTALAGRFRDAMGDTPLNHLRTIRMQRATQLLADTGRRLEAVATAVGYQDAFGFSKVFKRTLGVSPKEFRRRDAAERALPYRFAAG
jgi:transcriptional regulator GlxA family with amidase domain